MPIVPEFVLALVIAHLDPLLNWLSDIAYNNLVQRAKGHLLVELHARLDFTLLEKACGDYHHSSGPGAPPMHAVPHLVRALLVKYLFKWSLRQLEFQLRFNLVVKWFVGYPIFAAGPDHTTLERFDLWVSEHQQRAYFDTVLRQIDADFPEEREQAQIGDTFAMRADAAKEPLVRLIRHTCQRLLVALAAADPTTHENVTAQWDDSALFGVEDEPSFFHLSSAERRARLQTTVLAALQCADLVRNQLETTPGIPPAGRQLVEDWLNNLDKILADEVRLTRDAEGQVVEAAVLPKDKKGSYRIGSATDPDATYRVHGDNKVDFGFNVSATTTTTFIREIQVDTGARPDQHAIPDMLTAQREHHDLTPSKYIYDAAAGDGKTQAAVEKATDGQTQLVAPLRDYGKRSERFGPADFSLSEDGETLTCPNGQSTTIAYRSGSGDGRNFRIPAQQCAGCPLWDDCRDPEARPDGMRQVFISDYRLHLEAAQAYNQTDDFKADMKLRSAVERITSCPMGIAALTRYNGARHADRRGQDKSDYQAKPVLSAAEGMNATAFNIKTWLRLLAEQHTGSQPSVL